MGNMIWVIKVGSQAITDGGPLQIQEWMRQVGELKVRGIHVVWVTSGAIASARRYLKDQRATTSIAERQALSALGQPLLMNTYLQALEHLGLRGAQILLTSEDLKSEKRRSNVRNCIAESFQLGVLPILNENDATATDEIQFGDNDHLSALVAELVQAQRLVILSDVDGYFSANPKVDPQAQLLPILRTISDEQIQQAGAAGKSASGRGGMASKLMAARLGLEHGFVVHIAKANVPDILPRLASGEEIGTRFERQSR